MAGHFFSSAIYRQLIIHGLDWISINVREIDLFGSGPILGGAGRLMSAGDAGQNAKQASS